MPKKIQTQKLIVYDLDETLVLTEAGQKIGFGQHCSNLYGLAPKAAEQKAYQAFIEHGCTFAPLAQERGHNDAWIKAQHDAVAQIFLDNMHHYIAPCGRLRSQLTLLVKRGYTLAVLTQAATFYAHAILKYLNIADYFTIIMGRDCVNGALKRTTTPYLHLLDKLEEPPQEMHMLEDSPANLPAAHELGFKTSLIGRKPPADWMTYHAPDVKTWNDKLLTDTLRPHTYIAGTDVGPEVIHASNGC